MHARPITLTNNAISTTLVQAQGFIGRAIVMSVLEDLTGATTSELSDELIFQIASASSPEQRKYAADLFRYFAKQLEFESYRRGQQSMAVPQLPSPAMIIDATPEQDEAPTIQPSDDPGDDPSVGLIPPVSWQD
jgi:hypothetical protein